MLADGRLFFGTIEIKSSVTRVSVPAAAASVTIEQLIFQDYVELETQTMGSFDLDTLYMWLLKPSQALPLLYSSLVAAARRMLAEMQVFRCLLFCCFRL